MRLLGLAAVLAFLTVHLLAEQPDQNVWQYDAVAPEHVSDTSAPNATDINSVNDLLAKMLKCWNEHDISGYLAVLWDSPQLLMVMGSEQFQGWNAVRAAYEVGFSDPGKMGHLQPLRTQVKITKPGLALVEDQWIAQYPGKNTEYLGSSTMTVQKLEGTWKVVSSYSNYSTTTSRGWEYDSIAPESTPGTPVPEQDEIKAISNVLASVDACWNARDIDGMMSAYWNSPYLIIIDGEEQVQGWEVLYKTFKTGYPDPNTMGRIEPSRVQVKLLKPDLALALNWWTITYSNSKTRVVGNTTMNLQKFTNSWKIIMAHSSFVEP